MESPDSQSILTVQPTTDATATEFSRKETNKSYNEIASLASIAAIPNYDEISLWRESLFIFLMCMSQLITQAAVAQAMNTATYIAKTFNIENIPGEISWFSASFSLTVGTFILISGRLGDMHGYKLMYIVGYIWLGTFSLATGFVGFSSSSILFDIMRALQGIGPAIMMPNSQALIGSYYPPGFRKNMSMCLFGSVAPTGFIIGALFGGLFSQLVWWPWNFWLCGIVSYAVAAFAYFIIPQNIGGKPGGSFDYWGSISGVSGLVLINFAWNQGPVVGWDTPYVYALLILGFICITAFIYIEGKVKDPLVPPGALKGETGAVLLCMAAGWSCFGIWLFYTYRWALVVDGDSAVMSAVKNIPSLFTGLIAAVSTAFMSQRIPSSVILLLAMLSFFVGIILMGTRPVGQIYWAQKFVSLLVQPFGMDMSFPAGCIILSSALPKSHQGMAGSLVSTFVNYSISIGLGFAGTVEYYITKNMEPGLETNIHGIRVAFYMGFGLAGLGVLVSASFVYYQLILSKRQLTEGKDSSTGNSIRVASESSDDD
ncbi:major facilitator superfamily domain-containing protein [Scheffersomyces xylosifermentans]|uniref:major facilitator superfamily domain-containing protein n=1 Tax=Scheffersomyces xylosifermentans TaxID=1304137 RepID=UPI00315D025F